MFTTQLEERYSKCKNVKIDNNITGGILQFVKKLTKAGVIKIIYTEDFDSIKDDILDSLLKNDYNADSMLFEGSVYPDEIYENCEGIILLGSTLSSIFSGDKCIIVVDNLDMFEVLHKEYFAVLVADYAVKLSAFNLIANCYGKLMIKLVSCFDFKMYCICYDKNNDYNIIESIENQIVELFSKNYIYYRDEKFINDLLECIINVGLLESMLADMNVLDGYEITCRVVQSISKSKKMSGEYAMLVGWYILNTLVVQEKMKSNELFIPCDIMSDLDYVSNRLNESKTRLLKIADKITAKEYSRLSFIGKEYTAEIDKYLNKIYPCSQNAMKNYRRIYYDAGLELSASVTLNGLSESVLKSVAFNPNYSYLKVQHIMGVV